MASEAATSEGGLLLGGVDWGRVLNFLRTLADRELEHLLASPSSRPSTALASPPLPPVSAGAPITELTSPSSPCGSSSSIRRRWPSEVVSGREASSSPQPRIRLELAVGERAEEVVKLSTLPNSGRSRKPSSLPQSPPPRRRQAALVGRCL